MLKTLKVGNKIQHGFKVLLTQRRFFLSDAYRCEEAWKHRLQTPVLQKIQPTNLFFKLEQIYNNTKKVSPIDIDIFANTIVDEFQTEELLTFIYNLRLTSEASNIMESTHHAVIRLLLHFNHTEDLVTILHDRLNYGIFPDHMCYNLLMDTYIKKKEYATAAKFAVLPMLQEDFQHPITNALSVYSCHKYLENPGEWQKPEEKQDDSEEEIKIRVAYIRNPYFDDHFDLTDPKDLVGKTLAFQGNHMNNTLGRTCQLRGLILFKKYEDVSKLIEGWRNIKEAIVHKEVFDLIKQDNKSIPEDQVTDELKNLLSQLDELKNANLCDNSLTQDLENNVKAAIGEQAEKDISQQCETYLKWEKIRDEELHKHLTILDRTARLAKLKEIKRELKQKERLLTFFDREEAVELQIEYKKELEKKTEERVARVHASEKKLRQLAKEKERTAISSLE